MAPTSKSKHSEFATSTMRQRAEDLRAGKVPREHLHDYAPLMQGLALRRVFSLGPVGADAGEPAVALGRAVRGVIYIHTHTYKTCRGGSP
jgi:hypothetical protein